METKFSDYSIRIEELKNKMNEYGALGIPFLFAINFELTETLFIENPTDQNNILFHTPKYSNQPKSNIQTEKAKLLKAYPISYNEYKKRFDITIKGLKRGDSFLTNLTVKTPIETDYSLKEIFLQSSAPYCLYVPNRFVCFSPERFIHIKDGYISTNPMKGTINADLPNAAEIILADAKETAEHNTIVDLLRNDISMVAEKVHVKRFRYIDHIKTNERNILQVSSEIVGQLNKDYLSYLGDIIIPLLPAGSISGAPKDATLQIIRQAENEPRGFYSGIFGYFDGTELDSAVIIRYIEEDNGKKIFRSGGGITAKSNPESEYNEVIEKIYLPFL